MRTEIKEIKKESLYLSNLMTCPNINTVEPLGTDSSLIRTPLYYGQFPMSRQKSDIFSLKKTSIIRTLSKTDTKSRSRPRE